jgi:hypothetical protein
MFNKGEIGHLLRRETISWQKKSYFFKKIEN